MNTRIIIIDMDKERHLKFGMNALVKLEKDMGKPLSEMDENNFAMSDLVSMFKAGLYWEDKALTDEDVGDIMDDAIEKHGMSYLSSKLGEAIKKSLGDSKNLPSK